MKKAKSHPPPPSTDDNNNNSKFEDSMIQDSGGGGGVTSNLTRKKATLPQPNKKPLVIKLVKGFCSLFVLLFFGKDLNLHHPKG